MAYLTANNLKGAAQALRAETNLGENFDDATAKKYEGLLEKKWTSVVRLQKKVGTLLNSQAMEAKTDAPVPPDHGPGNEK